MIPFPIRYSDAVLPDASGSWPLPHPYDLVATTRTLRTGPHDPTSRIASDGLWRTTHTPEGPVTVRVHVQSDALHADAWGPGAAFALSDLPRWLGLDEPVWAFAPHPVVDDLARHHRGLRGTDTRDPFDALVLTVLMQLVTWQHGAMTWRRLCRTFGERAPGPADLYLPPTPAAIRAAGTWRLESIGIGGKQARTLMEVARVPHVVRRVTDMPTTDAMELLQKIKGVGPWTAATVLGDRLGRPDPIPLGDFHLPNTIAWALAGEARANDARMVALLTPFEGQAYRVIRLVLAAGIGAPKFGPRRRGLRRTA